MNVQGVQAKNRLHLVICLVCVCFQADGKNLHNSDVSEVIL